jgi:hypothetical protein
MLTKYSTHSFILNLHFEDYVFDDKNLATVFDTNSIWVVCENAVMYWLNEIPNQIKISVRIDNPKKKGWKKCVINTIQAGGGVKVGNKHFSGTYSNIFAFLKHYGIATSDTTTVYVKIEEHPPSKHRYYTNSTKKYVWIYTDEQTPVFIGDTVFKAADAEKMKDHIKITRQQAVDIFNNRNKKTCKWTFKQLENREVAIPD